MIDKVTAIKAEKNQVVLERQVLSYDYLIVAFGGSKMQPKGVENTTTICGTPDQTLELRSRIDELIARGSGKIAIGFGGNPNDKSAVRGGPAFELMFNLHYYLKKKGLRDRFDLTMKIAFFAIPILWKKLVVTIWNPITGKNITTILSPFSDMACFIEASSESKLFLNSAW